MTEKSICLKNPKEDPLDGHRLVPGKGPSNIYPWFQLISVTTFEVIVVTTETAGTALL